MTTKPKSSDWKLDHSTPVPILVYKSCSVIESEVAEYVLRLIREDDARTNGKAALISLSDCEASFCRLAQARDLKTDGTPMTMVRREDIHAVLTALEEKDRELAALKRQAYWAAVSANNPEWEARELIEEYDRNITKGRAACQI